MKLIKVDWEDTLADVGWSDDRLTTVKVASVGWLIHKDKDKVVLSSMIGTAGLEDFNCRQAIPRGCIKKITILKE